MVPSVTLPLTAEVIEGEVLSRLNGPVSIL